MRNILALCIGNLCRSPTAEALLARELPARRIWSAGLNANDGHPADPLAVAVAAGRGLDLSTHRSQQFRSWMCDAADLILVMDLAQQAEIARVQPQALGKVFRLGELQGADIADPYRRPRVAFEAAYDSVARGVTAWVQRIHRLRCGQEPHIPHS